MSEKVRVLISEEKIEKRICEMGKEISEFYSKENVLNIWIDFYTKVHEEHQKNKKQKRRRMKKKKVFNDEQKQK